MGSKPIIILFGALCLSVVFVHAEHHKTHDGERNHQQNHEHGHQHASHSHSGTFSDEEQWIRAKMTSTHVNDAILRLMAELSENHDRLKGGHDMSDKVHELNRKLDEIFEFLNGLRPQYHDHNVESDLKPEQILEDLQEAHALVAPFHSNFVVHGNSVVINQEKLRNEHGKAGKIVDEAFENTAGESNVDRAIDVGKFLLDRINASVKRHYSVKSSQTLDKHWKKTLTWALTSAMHAKHDVQRYVNRLEGFKNKPNSEEANGDMHGRVEHSRWGHMNHEVLKDMLAGRHRQHNPLSEMPFAGEESLSSEHHHKRNRNALTEMPFAGEESLSAEHHHKRNRNALTEMPFAGEESLSSEHHHKRNRNALTEMPFANEEYLSTEINGKIRKNRHGKAKQNSSLMSSSNEEHRGKKGRGKSEHMDEEEYIRKVTDIAHIAHLFGRAVKISPDGQLIVNKTMLQGNDDDAHKVQKMLRQSMHMPQLRGDPREIKKAAESFLSKMQSLMGETHSRMINLVTRNGPKQNHHREREINTAVRNMGYAQEQVQKILRGLKSMKSLRRRSNKDKKRPNKMQLYREQPYGY